MPRECNVCIHHERDAIEAAIAAGRSGRRIADQYGISYSSVFRHGKNHMEAKQNATTEQVESKPTPPGVVDGAIQRRQEGELYGVDINELLEAEPTNTESSDERALRQLQKEDAEKLGGFKKRQKLKWPDPIRKRFVRKPNDGY